MNKHYIRNLVKKSGIELTSNGFNVYTEFASLSELEKFAELIVRECIAWVEDNNGHDGPSISEMKEHFGVEE